MKLGIRSVGDLMLKAMRGFILKSTCYSGIAWRKCRQCQESIPQSSSTDSIAANDFQFHSANT